jgi:hypothetical protein
MIHASDRPLRSERKAIMRTSGEKNGLLSVAGSRVRWVNRPSLTRTLQISGFPARAEKKRMV